jgi:hypothetical protein
MMSQKVYVSNNEMEKMFLVYFYVVALLATYYRDRDSHITRKERDDKRMKKIIYSVCVSTVLLHGGKSFYRILAFPSKGYRRYDVSLQLVTFRRTDWSVNFNRFAPHCLFCDTCCCF